jgi:ribosome biogenesis protein Nip4
VADVVNDRQAKVLKRLIEATHQDARVTVTAEPDGVQIVISGPGAAPGSSKLGETTLSLSDDGQFLRRFLARHAS